MMAPKVEDSSRKEIEAPERTLMKSLRNVIEQSWKSIHHRDTEDTADIEISLLCVLCASVVNVFYRTTYE